MKRFSTRLLPVLALALTPLLAHAKKGTEAPAASSGGFNWENAIVQIENTSKEYNYIVPWAQRERKAYKSGVVMPDHVIITTADSLNDQTLIRLKKQGGGLFSLGKLLWIDYQANLAAVTTDEKDFWTGLQPAKLADPTPITGPVRIMRWRDDLLESRQGDISSIVVDNSALSFVSVPALRIDSTIAGAGWSEAVTAGDKLVGLTSAQGGDAVTAIPSSFIEQVLKGHAKKDYAGLGYFDFTWDPAENPLCLDYLKLPGPTRGVIIKETGLKPGVESPVKPRDVLLEVDGFAIDAEGNYHDPQYKKLCLENLSSRGKAAGDVCKFKIWRDGKEMTIDYKLPKADYSDSLVPSQSFDHDPEYVIAGGFVFVPLSEAYLRSWGGSWRQRAPFRLTYYTNGKVKPDRLQRVIVGQVLPNQINIGYENIRNMAIDEINGKKITQISDIPIALQSPINGFDVFKFESGESVTQAVLDASEIDKANQEILARYQIPSDHVLNSKLADIPATSDTDAASVVKK